MKGKYFVLLSSILASTTLASIGFATWIITGNSTKETEDNEILVDDISDKRISLDYEWIVGNGKVTFGYKTDTDIQNPWLTNSNSTTQENLSNTLQIKITNADYLKDESALNFNFTVNDNTDGGWAKAVAANYVVAPTFTSTSINKSDITINDNNTGTYDLKIDFAWGKAFDGKNPYTYYNGKTYSDDLANEAKTNLGNLKSYVEGVTFKLTINAYAA